MVASMPRGWVREIAWQVLWLPPCLVVKLDK
jgi:hypothetical protein